MGKVEDMAETTTGAGDGKVTAATKPKDAPDTVEGGAGEEQGTQARNAKAPETELERQARAQLEADQAAAKKVAAAATAKGGRPRTADLEAKQRELQEAERRQAELIEEGRKAIEARKAKGEGSEAQQGAAVWARFVGNPAADGEGPEYEEMFGYTFRKDGEWILVKGDDVTLRKFRGNSHFQTEEVSEEEADDLTDGDVREASAAERKPKRTIGKTG